MLKVVVMCRCPRLFKSSFHVPSLLLKTQLVLVFVNRKKFKEDFHFQEKRQKAKTASSVFCSELLQRQLAPEQKLMATASSVYVISGYGRCQRKLYFRIVGETFIYQKESQLGLVLGDKNRVRQKEMQFGEFSPKLGSQ